MSGWKMHLDEDLLRAGFNEEVFRTEGVEVGYTERLSALATFTIVITYIGGKLLNKATDGALSRPIDKVLEFARSKQARLDLEFEERDLDPRIKVIMARMEDVKRDQFEKALSELKFIAPKAQTILNATKEYIEEIYFVWDGDAWVGTYYLTEGGVPVPF